MRRTLRPNLHHISDDILFIEGTIFAYTILFDSMKNRKEHMKKRYYSPIELTVDLIGGKWKLAILLNLSRYGKLRFGELCRLMPSATQRMVTMQLRDLEKNGFISRKVFPVVPPRVEYTLTALGKSLEEILEKLCLFGHEYASKHDIEFDLDKAQRAQAEELKKRSVKV
jgi:DNA-binding HxlR family transcriptional regulator